MGRLTAAIAVVEQLAPSQVAAVSLCDLYIQAERYEQALEVTNGVTNEDDPSALLLAYRGVALREQGLNTASLEAFREALKSSKRSRTVRHLALVERAATYIAEGRKAQARKDLERVLGEDPAYAGVKGLLAIL